MVPGCLLSNSFSAVCKDLVMVLALCLTRICFYGGNSKVSSPPPLGDLGLFCCCFFSSLLLPFDVRPCNLDL